MRKTFIFGTLVALSLTASAANRPTKFVMLNSMGKIQLYSSSDKAVVSQNLQRVSSTLSGGALNLPTELPVLVPKQFGNAFFDPMSFMLFSPYQININGATKHPNSSRVIEMHEYGHSIFDENIDRIFKHDASKLRILRDFRTLRELGRPNLRPMSQADFELQMLMPVIEARKLPDDHPVTQDAIAIATRMKEEEAKFMEIAQNEIPMIQAAQEILMSVVPFNEFFADVVAVTYTRDPQALLRAIRHTKNEGMNFSDRSFKLPRSKRALDTAVHNFYSLSRDYIYKYFLSDAGIRANGNTWIVLKTLDSINCAVKQEAAVDQLLKDEFRRQTTRVTWERFELEGKNKAFNKCIETTFESR